MSTKKPDISKIDKYLKGELDSRAMHQLEREAQDDPFLMDALEGYQSAGKNQRENLDELKNRLANRIAVKKGSPVIMWRVLSAAACLLLAIGIAYWVFKPKTVVKQYADLVELKKPVETPAATKQASPQQVITKQIQKHAEPPSIQEIQSAPPTPQNSLSASAKMADDKDKTIYKADTVEYRANNYKVNRNTTTDDFLKKMAGMQVEPDGNIVSQGKAITKARVNGKDFAGGNVQSAVKNLPADVLEKLTDSAVSNIVAGKVVDETGQPIPGVTVRAKNNPSIITSTDAQGNYKINIPDNNKVLDFNFIGYVSKELLAKNNAPANVALQPNNSSLNEVVVVGYGTQKKSNAEPHPANGQKNYDEYIDEEAIMPDGSTGNVKVAFDVKPNGTITNIHVTSGRNKAMNDKAIEIIKDGPKWIGGAKTKEVKLKIKFHK